MSSENVAVTIRKRQAKNHRKYINIPIITFSIILVDVWSVGCIFAEILLGHPMFMADSLKIWQKITEEVGTPNQDFLSRVSEPARAYVMLQPVYKAK
jgi:serine/threonine protein kinase